VKILFIAPAFAAVLLIASVANAQAPYSVQESGDIFGDIVRNNQANSAATLSSPFNMGFVDTPTSPIMNAVFQTYNQGSSSSPEYFPDLLMGTEYINNVQSASAIWINFSPTEFSGTFPAQAVTMVGFDYTPCIEAKIPKGTYTFQATATPTGGGSTPGTFMFETCTTGIWTVQFNLALPKPEGATRTLTFAHDTKVRWLLVPVSGQEAVAVITAKYYNSGS
jgi:hypothetical protein